MERSRGRSRARSGDAQRDRAAAIVRRPALAVAAALLGIGLGLPASRPTGNDHSRADELLATRTHAIADRVLSRPLSQRRKATGWWGRTYTAATGEPVTIFLSERYPADEARAQRWADFLASLVHGPELARLTVLLAPADIVRMLCGEHAAGCYSRHDQTMLAPGDDHGLGGWTAEQIVTHEYGHHVANNRANPPWDALTWGTKRWATNAAVCARQRAGTASRNGPGHYRLQPGEAFAEAYRALNEVQSGAAEFAWPIVDASFRPDAPALQHVHRDVVRPWKAVTLRLAGAFRRGAPSTQQWLVQLPLDGRLEAFVDGPAPVRLSLIDPFTGRTVADGRRVGHTICGQRALTVRVDSGGARGDYVIRLRRP